MNFFLIEPEISGSPRPGHLSGAVVFDTWLGDDLIRAYPAILVTTPLKKAIASVAGATGFSLVRAGVQTSPFFRKHSPGKRLPAFWAIQVRGRAGLDDIGLGSAGVVVISQRILDILMGFRIGRAVMMQYVPGGVPSGGQRPSGVP